MPRSLFVLFFFLPCTSLAQAFRFEFCTFGGWVDLKAFVSMALGLDDEKQKLIVMVYFGPMMRCKYNLSRHSYKFTYFSHSLADYVT